MLHKAFQFHPEVCLNKRNVEVILFTTLNILNVKIIILKVHGYLARTRIAKSYITTRIGHSKVSETLPALRPVTEK